MKIQKIGHCCLLIEYKTLRILTDPGMFTIDAHSALTGIDVILITHEHGDHIHTESLKKLLENNPAARVFTIQSVKAIIEKEHLRCELLEHGQSVTIEGILFEAFGEKHAAFHSSIPQITNTGFLIGEKFFYPGDAFTDPGKPVDILALPVGGPWMKIAEAVDYALKLKPKVVFPVHDAVYTIPGLGAIIPSQVLPNHGVRFEPIDGKGMVYFD